MIAPAVCRRHTVPLSSYAWDGYTWLYRCPVGHHECESSWSWSR